LPLAQASPDCAVAREARAPGSIRTHNHDVSKLMVKGIRGSNCDDWNNILANRRETITPGCALDGGGIPAL
jgi:hypothetical protein